MYGETFYGRHTAQHQLQWSQIKFKNCHSLSDSYSMVCASVREDNPRASAGGLSPVQKHEPYSY